MLALSRKKDEAIIINDNIEVKILEIKGDQIKIGVSAPKSVPIYRKEVFTQIQEANKEASESVDMEKLKKRFPEASCIMLGRGILRNPELIEIMESGEKKIDAKKLRAFHDQIYQDYQEVSCGDKNVLFKMKELWCYLGTLFPDKEKQLKKIRKAEKLDRYEGRSDLASHWILRRKRQYVSASSEFLSGGDHEEQGLCYCK